MMASMSWKSSARGRAIVAPLAPANFPNSGRVRGLIRLSENQITGVTALAMVLNILFKFLERRFNAPMITTSYFAMRSAWAWRRRGIR